MNYQEALQQLLAKRQAAQPTPEEIDRINKQQDLGLLLNNLFKAQASVGNIAGKPTESTGIDFQDYGKAASEQMKQKNLLANQNFDQGLQSQQALMGVDKFAQDRQANELQQQTGQLTLQKNRFDVNNQQAEFDLNQRAKQAQIKKLEAEARANTGNDTGVGKDYTNAIKIARLEQSLKDGLIKDPATRKAAEMTVKDYYSKNSGTALTKGQEEQDKSFGKEYQDWVSIKRPSAIQHIATLDKVLGVLNKGEGSGSVLDRLPKAFRTRESVALQQDVDTITAEGIKNILGGQLTEKDREFVTSNTYDPTQPASVNATRVNNLKNFILQKVQSQDAAGRIFEQTGSISTYKPLSAQLNQGSWNINMKFPDGKVKVVPAADVEKYKAMGGIIQ